MKFFLFILLFFGGTLYVVYHRKIVEMVNLRIGWAEKYFGSGGTYIAHILFGLAAIIIGLLIISGWIPIDF